MTTFQLGKWGSSRLGEALGFPDYEFLTALKRYVVNDCYDPSVQLSKHLTVDSLSSLLATGIEIPADITTRFYRERPFTASFGYVCTEFHLVGCKKKATFL